MLLDRRAIERRAAIFGSVEQVPRALKDVLIRERGRGIDAVHDRVGLVANQQLKQEVAFQDRIGEITEQVAEHESAVLGLGHNGRHVESRDGRRHEDVAPFDVDRHAAAVGLERARGGSHFVFEQRHEHEAARRRRRRQDSPRHRVPDETAPAEQHYRPISELHVVARLLRSLAG